MIGKGRNEAHANDKLLAVIMALLNISVLLGGGVIAWTVFLIIENTTAIAKIMNGGFLP